MVICFFAPAAAIATERARRRELVGAAFVLLSEDGAIAVADELAAARGVRAGQSVSGARALCPGLITLPYDCNFYMTAARAAWDIAAEEFSVVEPVSPELFFVLADRTFVLKDTPKVATRLSASIGAPVQCGIAASKFTAQHAATRAAAGSPVTIAPGREYAALAAVPVGKIPGVPTKVIQRLDKLGIRTLGDAAGYASRLPKDLRHIGGRLAGLALGRDGDRVRAMWPEQIEEASISFDDPAEHMELIDRALGRCAQKIGERLQERREYCRSLSLTVCIEGAASVTHSERLVLPAASVPDLFRGAQRLFARIRAGAPVTGLHLVAGELGAGSGVQLSLLSEEGGLFPEERTRQTAAAANYIRSRWGSASLSNAGAMLAATKVSLRVYPLGHLVRQAVTVEAIDGVPVQFSRRRRREVDRFEVAKVQNRWRETDHFGGLERHVYRVQTTAGAMAELHRVGSAWTLQAMAD